VKFQSHHFREVYAFDFEFHHNGNPGNRPVPVCLAADELLSGRKTRLWLEGGKMLSPPYPTGEDVLFVAYYAGAEVSCHLSLGWPVPHNVLDLFCEFKSIQNGNRFSTDPKTRWSLLSALMFYGLSSIDAEQKNSMRDRILGGPPYPEADREQILKYCASDVEALCRLLSKMLPSIEMPYALMRGRFAANCAIIEDAGIPIDTEKLNMLDQYWDNIKLHLIEDVDKDFGIYQGTTFSQANFISYLSRHNVSWPTTPTGKPKLDQETFKDMCASFPALLPLKELRATTDQLKLKSLQVGEDGRNRCLLSPFGTVTSRCAPSNAKYIFGPATWIRALMKPGPGQALAYLDYDQQEFAVAAALSGDQEMQTAYKTGDPYLSFAKQAKAVPPDATKDSHPVERDLYKQCILAIGYGMGYRSFAIRIQQPEPFARKLLRQHQETYPDFWRCEQ
jgi:hypothetical protein